MSQSEQYQLAVGLDCYKSYQSETPDGVPARMLGPQEGGLWDPTSVEDGKYSL